MNAANAKTAMLEHVESLIAATKESSKNMTNKEYQTFRKSLQEAIGVYKGQEDTERGMALFDSIAKQGERGDMALEVTLNSLGMKEATAGVAEYVAGQLAKLGSMPKVETDTVKRFKELVARLNKNIVKGGIVFNGKDLSELCLEAQIKVAPCMREQMFTYTSSASVGHTVNGKQYKSLVLETIGECRHE